jgi:hypothetical protein
MYDGLIKKGPLVVFVSASSKSFINYASGIYNDIKCSSNEDSLDHALDIVGCKHLICIYILFWIYIKK